MSEPNLRGEYIISQALHYGIKALEEVEGSLRENSNIEDMKRMRAEKYDMFLSREELEKLVAKTPSGK